MVLARSDGGIWLEQIGMKRGFANVEMIRLPTAAALGVGGCAIAIRPYQTSAGLALAEA